MKKLTFFKIQGVQHSGAHKFWLILFFFTCGFNSRNAGIKWFKEHSVKFGGQRHCALVPQVLGQPGVRLL